MRLLALLLLAATLAQPATGQPRSTPTTSEVTGRLIAPSPQPTVPPDATLSLRLVDESGARPEIIARYVQETDGQQFPILFSLPYTVGAIVPGRRYRVRADLYDASRRRLWSNDADQTSPFVRFDADGMPASLTEVTGQVDAPAEPVGPGYVQAPRSTAVPRTDNPPPRPAPPATPRPPEPLDRTADALAQARWQLVGADPSTDLDAGTLTPYTLTLRYGRMFSGTAACRSFAGTYDAQDGGAVALGPATTGIERCDPTPADTAFERLLAGATRFGTTFQTLELEGDAGTLRFSRIELPDGTARPLRGEVSELVCGAAGAVRVRTGTGDVQLWLSDALAGRRAAAGRVGIYHVLPQTPSADPARYADGPLGLATDGTDAALILGDERFACTPAPAVPSGAGRPGFNVFDDEANVEVYPDGRGHAYISIYDGTVVEMTVDVTTPETGRTVYRGPFGFVLTTIAGGCDGPDPTRAVVEQPERTYEVCIPALP